MDFDVIREAVPILLGAVDETLILAASSLTLGFFLSVCVALMRLSANRAAAGFARSYVYIFRSTPLLVQIFLIYYGAGQFNEALDAVDLWAAFKEPWFCAILALTLNTTAYGSEVIRGGIQSVPEGQIEAARGLGLSRWRAFRKVVFPLALRQALPAYGNEIILMVKATSLVSTITILDITGEAGKIIAATYRPLEVFLIAGSIYLAINFAITRAVAWLEKRMDPVGETA